MVTTYLPYLDPKQNQPMSPLGSGPWLPSGSSLKSPRLAWMRRGPNALELAVIGRERHLFWRDLTFSPTTSVTMSSARAMVPEPLLAVTIVRSGLVAAVTGTAVHWLRRTEHTFRSLGTTWWPLPNAVACFPHYPTRELVVVCGDGTVIRLPLRLS
jgi:hypothetical protein